MLLWLALSLLSCAVAEYESSFIEPWGSGDACDSVRLTLNQALIRFESPTSANLELINSFCHKCSWTWTASPGTCALLYTPHDWEMRAVDPVTGATLAYVDAYRFGEHGKYNITLDVSSSFLEVTTVSDSVDALLPLMILLGLIAFIVIASFLIPYLWNTRNKPEINNKERDFNVNSTARNSLLAGDAFLDRELGIRVDDALLPQLQQPRVEKAGQGAKPSHERLHSLDTFRGLTLCLMIFVNYGGGSYWFFDHAYWNGLTLADLLFPWFMWMMGVSMALSFRVLESKGVPPADMWKKAIRRSLILFGLGMFLANGYELSTWRIPGVLQYFGVSYMVTCATVFLCRPSTKKALDEEEKRRNTNPSYFSIGTLSLKKDFILWAYRFEWVLQLIIVVVYVAVTLGAKVPGCPRGYMGPGGIADEGEHPDCTGGIHRYLDIMLFTDKLIYHHPTCKGLYGCKSYDPEGFLGVLTACTLTYTGLMSGRVIVHFKSHRERLGRWALWAATLLLIGGILCGFSTNGGLLPVNKNLWTTSFGVISAGGGLVMLGMTYVIVDVLKAWTGAPFISLGMNSILLYCAHGLLGGYFPFGYQTDSTNHAKVLYMNVFGTLSWIAVAVYFHKIKFFVKI